MKQPFDYDISKDKRYDLHLYIKSNLYEEQISIKTKGKLVVFAWNYEPQLAGKHKQREAYQFRCISLMIDEIIKTLNK